MSMAQPFQPNIHPDKGIPAADAGAGAPEPSPGFGIGGEPDGVGSDPEGDAAVDAGSPDEDVATDVGADRDEPNPFRPPEPDDAASPPR